MDSGQPLSEWTDDRLMALVAGDSTQALEEIMTRWQQRVFVFILRGVRDADVAEELTQESFWRLWRARQQYRPADKFSSWLFRIAARLCQDHYRRVSRRPRLMSAEDAVVMPAPPSDRADRAALSAELNEHLDRALAGLPVNQRLALEMAVHEDMSYKEIAGALGCSPGAVEQLVFRARRALRESLADYLPAQPAHSRKSRDAT